MIAEYRGLGLPRIVMPQIKDVKGFIRYLDDIHIPHDLFPDFNVFEIMPTQMEMNNDKVLTLMELPQIELTKYPYLVSSDLYLIDGHHRWLALKSNNERYGQNTKIDVIIIDQPIDELLKTAKEYGDVSYKTVNETKESI